MENKSFEVKVLALGEVLSAAIVFEPIQMYEPDLEDDELFFGAKFDTFLCRLNDGRESMVFEFAGRQRKFNSFEDMLRVLGESGIEVISVAFDGVHYQDECDEWTTSASWGYTPAELLERRALHSAQWELN